jgi:outer membrane receptor for monomeric catechols
MTNQTVAERIADSDRELAATRFREQQGYGNRKHKANVWTRYMISDGRLKGLTLGGGWRYQSANISGINVATQEVFKGNPKSLFDFMASYRTKGFFGFAAEKVAVTYQVNVLNLLDDRTIFIAKHVVDTVTGEKYIARAWHEDPRMSTFTMRLAF